jgi:xanthine dehydrogenase molybdopterin-binding subunit B
MMAIENIIDNISRFLKKDPADVRKINFYGKNNKTLLIME